MPTYSAPGVYIEEVSGGSRPIQAVGTSTAGFVGIAPNVRARVNEAVAVNNWTEFVRIFASTNGNSTHLAQAVRGFFDNGGSRCYVVNVGAGGSLVGTGGQQAGLDLLKRIDEIAIVAAPGYSDAVSYEAIISHCEQMGDRVGILDAPENVPDINQLTKVATASGDEEESAGTSGGLRPRQSDGGYAAVYFPWITVRDPLENGRLVNVPPSGHLAGIWARTDATRGVHKAPANEPIRGAVNLTYALTSAEQGELNQNGVNCIRFFANEGILVWGARTIASGSSEWRYLNVRRLFNMIEESIGNSTRWVVFEPNDRPLWKAIRRDISAFLTRLWRDGALMGRTAEEAFFVKCDDETNPQENIDAGQVTTLIGLAPVKPAEFIVFRVSQHQSGTEIDG
ncbi:MAG: phage tail sheath C-terminal domain-containing protein [Chloroflexota bacterium]